MIFKIKQTDAIKLARRILGDVGSRTAVDWYQAEGESVLTTPNDVPVRDPRTYVAGLSKSISTEPQYKSRPDQPFTCPKCKVCGEIFYQKDHEHVCWECTTMPENL